MRNSLRPRKTKMPEARFSMKSPLLAALAACSILSCDPKIPEKPEPPKVPSAKVADASAKKRLPVPMKPAAVTPMAEPVMESAPPVPVAKAARKRPARKSGGPCGSFCHLAERYPEAAPILHMRVTQKRRKMKLTAEEGRLAASYLTKDLQSMPRSGALLKKMPKTTIELIRGVNERGVTKKDAEQMADYLIRFLKSMKMRNISTFDECISHMIGREWHQIDYSGEGMTWQGQRKMYNRKSPERMDWVKDIQKAVYLHRFFEIEHRMRYFRKLFAPAGGLPAAPKTE